MNYLSPLRRHWAWAGFVMILSAVSSFAQTPAFPGALGFGANVTGGRGGTVYHVTTLADSGAGSFRDAVSHSGRIIVFDVGGYISLQTAVSCSGNLTIAGQTAPGGGIGFKGGEISFSSRSNIICRFIRVRPGSDTASTGDDALGMADARDIICDHVSLEFAPWNNIDGVSDDWQNHPVTDITFQNCIIADPTGQQFGAHTESVSSTWSWYHNIFANSHNRNPLAKINTIFVNNVLYNCSAGYTTHTSTSFSHDIINNYFISGPASTTSSDFPWYQVDNNQSIYYSGNLLDNTRDGTLNGSTTTPYWYQGGSGTILTSPWSSLTTNAPIFSTATAYHYAVSAAGALPRDQMDNLVLSQVQTLGSGTTGTAVGTTGPDGGLYTTQTQTGLGNNGYGVINGGVAALDTDGDGMPDYWEKAVGLNPNSSSDATTIAGDGYANIEHYLNWLADPHALTSTNAAVDIDLWPYTIGFISASPAYTINNPSNGVVVLNSGHMVHFTPTANFTGFGGFQFVVTANDGSSYTNFVSVLISPVTPPSNLIWQGDGAANVWANGSGANWLSGTNLVTFNSGDNVTFDDTGANLPAINLSGSLVAGTVSVLAEQDYVFGGSGFLSGGTSLFKTDSGQLTLNTTNTFAGGTTINDGTLQIGDGVTFNGGLAGNVTNNSALVYATPGTLTNSLNITGPGTFTKNGTGSATITGTQTYTGPTTLNAGTLTFSGSVPPSNITDNGLLTLTPTASQFYTNVISGNGSVSVNATAVLTMTGTNTFAGNVTNNSGFLVLSNNQAAGLGTIVYNGGYVVAASGMTITNNFSIPSSTSDLSMMATNSGTATWAGNVVNLGNSASWRPGSDGGTLVFVGTAAQGARNFIIPRGAVQFASNAVVSATGTATAFGRDGSANNRSANITIKDNANVTVGVCSLGGGKAGGSVTVTVQDNAQLSFGANNLDLHNVTRNTAVTTLRLNGGTTTVGGFTKSQSSYTNIINFNGGILKAGVANATFLPVLSGQTDLVQAGGAIIDDGGFAITIAAPLTHDSTLGATIDGGLTKLGSGILNLAGANTYIGKTVINSGTLALSGVGLLGATTNIFIAAGATLDVSGSSSGTVTSAAAKTLWGNGFINGAFSSGTGWTFAPGSNAVGILTFNNSLTLASTSTNIFKISHAPLTNDLIAVAGALANNGTLIITNVGGVSLAAGDTFKLFNAGSYSGSFSNVKLPALVTGLIWNTNLLNTVGTISVVANNVVPVINNFALAGNSLIFSGTGGIANSNYYLLTSTNLINWNSRATNQFDGAGNFNLTNDVGTNGQLFFRLLIP